MGFLFLILYPSCLRPLLLLVLRGPLFTNHLSRGDICVAGVALGDIDHRFAGRRGTCSHQPSFRVAGVALVALGWLWWRAWARLVARGATIFGFFRFKMSTSMKKCRKLCFFDAFFSENFSIYFQFLFFRFKMSTVMVFSK